MRIALLISGGGTTMQAVIKACQDGTLPTVQPSLVIASKPDAGGIEKAKALGISHDDIIVLNRKSFKSEEEFGEAILAECKKRNIDFIGQYGWLAKTPVNVCDNYRGMIVNQHPGPLDNGRPDFGGQGMYGMRVHQARLEFVRKTNRDFWTEATAHRVTPVFDEGKIIKRKQIPIFQNDTAESLQARLLPIEHEVQIEVLQDFVNNKVVEFVRESSLVQSTELDILKECKESARKMYPNG
jgi:phosphoribosylglycinamide formyltransferase 1